MLFKDFNSNGHFVQWSQNCLYKFGRGHYGEHSCDTILKFGPVVKEEKKLMDRRTHTKVDGRGLSQ